MLYLRAQKMNMEELSAFAYAQMHLHLDNLVDNGCPQDATTASLVRVQVLV